VGAAAGLFRLEGSSLARKVPAKLRLGGEKPTLNLEAHRK
jgi:hypothetical protein